MLKKILLSIVITIFSSYLIFSVVIVNRRPADLTCPDIKVTLNDTSSLGFITKKEISTILKRKGLNPIGKPLADIQTKAIETELNKHVLIDKAECYKTPSGKIGIEITQRLPILKVMNDRGETYYIDNKGEILPPSARCIAHQIIATGRIEKSFARRELYNFGVFLQNNPFWNAQIEQIHILPDLEVELVPRVGDHIIHLGKLTNYEQKLEHLFTFYQKTLNKVGWNKYSRISVEFSNQIICTKRD